VVELPADFPAVAQQRAPGWRSRAAGSVTQAQRARRTSERAWFQDRPASSRRAAEWRVVRSVSPVQLRERQRSEPVRSRESPVDFPRTRAPGRVRVFQPGSMMARLMAQEPPRVGLRLALGSPADFPLAAGWPGRVSSQQPVDFAVQVQPSGRASGRLFLARERHWVRVRLREPPERPVGSSPGFAPWRRKEQL